MEKYVVADGIRQIGFTGTRISFVSTNLDGHRPRWTELSLWRMISDEQAQMIEAGRDPGDYPLGDFLAQSRGPSRYVHKVSGGCRKGAHAPVQLGTLAGKVVFCEACWPLSGRWPGDGDDPRDLLLSEMVRAEGDRPHVARGSTPEQIVEWLRDQPGARSRTVSGLSGPSEQLIADAAKVDPEWAAYVMRVENLTP